MSSSSARASGSSASARRLNAGAAPSADAAGAAEKVPFGKRHVGRVLRDEHAEPRPIGDDDGLAHRNEGASFERTYRRAALVLWDEASEQLRTVAAVGRFARAMLRGLRARGAEGPCAARPETVERFLTRSSVPGSSRALGWDTMLSTSSCGTRMSARAFGHTGFTGTSLWIDPEAGLYVVLLTNRVHPVAGDAEPIRTLRRDFHDAVMTDAGH